MRPLDVGPAYADAGLQTIRQACAQAHRMRWTVHRPNLTNDQRANAWRETLQSPDYLAPSDSSAQVGASRRADRTSEATSMREAEKENESQRDRAEESAREIADADRPAGEDTIGASATHRSSPVAGAGRLGPITAGAPHFYRTTDFPHRN